MSTDPEEIIDAAILLCEADRMRVVSRLLDTLPEEPPGMAIDDAEFLSELQRRSIDLEGAVPLSQLWDQD